MKDLIQEAHKNVQEYIETPAEKSWSIGPLMSDKTTFAMHFDMMQKQIDGIIIAEDLAFKAGYDDFFDNDTESLTNEINQLVGENWPSSVVNSYNEGREFGWNENFPF